MSLVLKYVFILFKQVLCNVVLFFNQSQRLDLLRLSAVRQKKLILIENTIMLSDTVEVPGLSEKET